MKYFRLGLCLLALTAAAPARSSGEPGRASAAAVTWYVLVAEDGAQIGYASSATSRTATGRRVVQEQRISLREKGGATALVTSRTVTDEDLAGRTLSVRVTNSAGRGRASHEARIYPGRAEITAESASGRRVVVLALPPTIRFDGGDGLLKTWDPGAAPHLEFDSLDVDGMAVDHVVIEPLPASPADPPGGMAVLRQRYENGQLRSIARLSLDRDRRIVATTQPMFGTRITLRLSDQSTVLRPTPPYRALPSMMIKSLFRIQPGALAGHIRYQFGFRDGIRFALPETSEQRPAAGSQAATLDICKTCGQGLPNNAAYLADARKATAWLQSDHPRLKAIAAPIARLRVSDARKMELLLRAARPYLGRIDFNGHYSALETLDRRAGDCTEAAVLLAALGRAAGIPTRVANGLVYSRERYHGVSNAFLPHSWTLAYVDGRWRSFDLALDTFDSSHIAITVGDGDARSLSAASQLGSLLEWRAMSEVRSPPAG